MIIIAILFWVFVLWGFYQYAMKYGRGRRPF